MGRPGCSGKREIPECRRQVRLGTGRSCVSSSPRAFSAFRYVRHECEVSSHYDSEPAIRRRPPTEIRSGQAERVSRLSVGPPVFRTPTNSTASAIRPARHRFPGSGIRRRRRDIPFFAFVRRFRRPIPQKPKGGRQPESGHIRTPPLVSPRSGGFFRQIEPNEVPSQPRNAVRRIELPHGICPTSARIARRDYLFRHGTVFLSSRNIAQRPFPKNRCREPERALRRPRSGRGKSDESFRKLRAKGVLPARKPHEDAFVLSLRTKNRYICRKTRPVRKNAGEEACRFAARTRRRVRQ